jgi:DNA repair protein RadA/Sms
MEGSRPLIAEVQALVTPTAFPAPRRTSNGIDYNRLCLILAVLEKRLGLKFSENDVYINVVSGLRVDDPSVDLALALALISSIKDIPIPQNVIAMGEIGLAGECRSISNLGKRLNEAHRLGFDCIAVPHNSLDSKVKIPKGVSTIPIQGVYDALSLFKGK